jgi:hypothetical protein
LAEAVATGLAGAGIAQSVQNVLSTVAGYIKEIIVQVARFGRQVIRISYEIAKELARPEVGVPFAILVYNASKLIRFDKTGVISAINSYFESVKTLNPVDVMWSYIRSGLSRVIDVSKVNSFWDLLNPFIAWDVINSSSIAPRLEVSIFGYTIDLGVIPRIFMFMAWYPVFITMSIPLAFLSLTWNIILAIIELQKNVITSVAGFIIDLLGWVGNILSWLACTYLKIVQPIIPLYFGTKNIGRGFKRAITSAIGGTLFTWIMMYAFASECVSVGIPSFPSPTPVTSPPTTPTPTIPSMEYTVIRSIKPMPSITSLPPQMVTIDKSLKIQFFWSRVGVAEYIVDKVLRPSVATEIIKPIELTVDMLLKPSIATEIIKPIELTVDMLLKPSIATEIFEAILSTIDKTLKPSIEYEVIPITEYVIDKSIDVDVVTEIVEPIRQVIDKSIKPVVEYTIAGEHVVEKTLKTYVEYEVATLSSQEIEKIVSISVSYEVSTGITREITITRTLKPSVSPSTGTEVIEVSDSNITITMPVTQISTETSQEEQGVVVTLSTNQISVEKIA